MKLTPIAYDDFVKISKTGYGKTKLQEEFETFIAMNVPVVEVDISEYSNINVACTTFNGSIKRQRLTSKLKAVSRNKKLYLLNLSLIPKK